MKKFFSTAYGDGAFNVAALVLRVTFGLDEKKAGCSADQCNAAVLTVIQATAGAAATRRQSTQWHTMELTGTASILYRTRPQ